MKKIIMRSAVISLVQNLILFFINLMCANIFHFLPFSYYLAGGECIEHIGFGINLTEIFVMSTSGSAPNTYDISFNFISLLIPLIGFFVILLILQILIEKFKKA